MYVIIYIKVPVCSKHGRRTWHRTCIHSTCACSRVDATANNINAMQRQLQFAAQIVSR